MSLRIDVDPDEVYAEPEQTDEERFHFFAKEVASLMQKVGNQAKVIREQETAIVMLKEYVLQNGLPAFWDPKVTTTLPKPIKDMTVGELRERNTNANKYRRAVSQDTAPFPTYEELVKQYLPKKTNASEDAIIETLAGLKPELTYNQNADSTAHFSNGSDDSDPNSPIGNFGMVEDD